MSHPLLEEAATLCAEANRIADRHASFLTQRGAVTPPPVKPAIAADLEKIKLTLEEADKKAGSRDYTAAAALLVSANDQCKAAEAKDKVAEEYKKKRKQVSWTVLNLPKGMDLREEVRKIEREDEAIDVEAGKLTVEAYTKAETMLAKVEVKCKALRMKDSMTSKTPPTPEQFEELLKHPDGTKLLDEMIVNLPENTPIAVFQAALKARFKLASVDVVKDAPSKTKEVFETGATVDDMSLRKIYEVMSKVPGSHTKENPSFKQIKRYAGEKTKGTLAGDKNSSFNPGSKEVIISCRRGDSTQQKQLAAPDELPPEARTFLVEGPDPQQFSWTTLHETGHAVDDKKGFMKKNGSGAAFGGWTSYGGDVMPAAQAAADHFKYEVTYIAKLLSGDTPNPAPDAPKGRSDWEACRKLAEEWAAAIRVDKSLWWNLVGSKKYALPVDGGTVFQESYAGSWVSYKLAARSTGVTGYQFRAPGEWFSEVYAAYGMKKLKTNHPAYGWLQKLFKDK